MMLDIHDAAKSKLQFDSAEMAYQIDLWNDIIFAKNYLYCFLVTNTSTVPIKKIIPKVFAYF